MRRWHALLISFSLIGVLTLVGCGSGGDDNDDPDPTPTPTPTASPTPTPTPLPSPTPDPGVVAILNVTAGQTYKVGETKPIVFLAQNAADAPVDASPTFALVNGDALQVPADGNATGINAEGTALVSATVGAIVSPGQTITVLPADEVTTASGLKYRDFRIQPGGEAAAPGKKATVAYIGTFTDGSEFDSGEFTFTVGAGQVIAGFDEGVARMSVGTKSRITVPPNLGYGNNPPAGIPANATLIFDVELKRLQ